MEMMSRKLHRWFAQVAASIKRFLIDTGSFNEPPAEHYYPILKATHSATTMALIFGGLPWLLATTFGVPNTEGWFLALAILCFLSTLICFGARMLLSLLVLTNQGSLSSLRSMRSLCGATTLLVFDVEWGAEEAFDIIVTRLQACKGMRLCSLDVYGGKIIAAHHDLLPWSIFSAFTKVEITIHDGLRNPASSKVSILGKGIVPALLRRRIETAGRICSPSQNKLKLTPNLFVQLRRANVLYLAGLPFFIGGMMLYAGTPQYFQSCDHSVQALNLESRKDFLGALKEANVGVKLQNSRQNYLVRGNIELHLATRELAFSNINGKGDTKQGLLYAKSALEDYKRANTLEEGSISEESNFVLQAKALSWADMPAARAMCEKADEQGWEPPTQYLKAVEYVRKGDPAKALIHLDLDRSWDPDGPREESSLKAILLNALAAKDCSFAPAALKYANEIKEDAEVAEEFPKLLPPPPNPMPVATTVGLLVLGLLTWQLKDRKREREIRNAFESAGLASISRIHDVSVRVSPEGLAEQTIHLSHSVPIAD
jgi:hypothetical protein